MSENTETAENAPPYFSIEKIYVKDLSVEIPHAPQAFLIREQPEVKVDLHTAARNVDEAVYEVTVGVTVTARATEKTLFLVEVTQAGIFQLRHFPPHEIDPVLGVSCPNILFPYLRETVSDVVVRAGFLPVLLTPVNFEVIYQARLAQMQSQTQDVTVQ